MRKGLLACGAEYGLQATTWEKQFCTRFNYFVAVDGGIGYFRSRNIKPDVLIGDFDSANTEDVEWAISKGVSIHLHPYEKDYLDSELAILTVSSICEEIGLIGVWGSRLDQSFSILSLLMLLKSLKIEAQVFANDTLMGLVRGRYTGVFSGNVADIWSFQALTPCEGVTIEGFKYPLVAEPIQPYQTRTISNVATDTTVKIVVEKGDLLYYHLLAGKYSQKQVCVNTDICKYS